MAGHILKTYDDDLNGLRDTVVQMGGLASASLENAIGCLLSENLDLCADVIADDEIIDTQEKKIDEQGMSILLRFNPVASDLRLVLSSINIGRSLERIGDHAVNIAKRSRKILKSGQVSQIRLIEPIYEATQEIVSMALNCYSDLNEQSARKVVGFDKKIDKANRLLGKSLTNQIAEGVDQTDTLLNIIFISRSLERIGDLSVNIAEDVVFMTSAEDIRHQ